MRRESEACGQSSTTSRAWCEQSQVGVDADTWINPTGQVVKASSEETFASKLEILEDATLKGIEVKSRYFKNNPEINNSREPLPTLEQEDGLLEPRHGKCWPIPWELGLQTQRKYGCFWTEQWGEMIWLLLTPSSPSDISLLLAETSPKPSDM